MLRINNQNLSLDSIGAILFDLDGVLIDSPTVHIKAWLEIFHQLKADLTRINGDDSDLARMICLEEGRQSLDIARIISARLGISLSDEEWERLIDQKRRIYRSHAPKGLRRDARRIIDYAVQRQLKIGLVSGSVLDNVKAAMDEEERSKFSVMVTSGDYSLGKPYAEPYITAARKLSVLPENCLVVENAPLGISSGRSAGMAVVALTSTLMPKYLADADVIVDSLDELVEMLEKSE